MLHQLTQALSRALPSICIVCGQVAKNDYCICHICECELPQPGKSCRRCGIELDGMPDQSASCSRCQLAPPCFDSCISAFPYVSPINKLVADFKFSARFDIGYSLARVLARTVSVHYADHPKPELLLPVPLHSSRLRARGFNQASEICKVLSKRCDIPVSNSALSKTRNTEPQTSMNSAAARGANLRGAFTIRDPRHLEDVTHIALVDDVVTTMTTAETISKLLQAQQIRRIDVWCLARAS